MALALVGDAWYLTLVGVELHGALLLSTLQLVEAFLEGLGILWCLYVPVRHRGETSAKRGCHTFWQVIDVGQEQQRTDYSTQGNRDVTGDAINETPSMVTC